MTRHVVEPERQQHGLLEPLVDGPGAVAALLGDARLAAVEQVERRLDRFAHRTLGRRPDVVALLEGVVDGLGEIGVGMGLLRVSARFVRSAARFCQARRRRLSNGDPVQEARQIVGDVVDVRRVAALAAPSPRGTPRAWPGGTTSTVVMPSACGTSRLRARSSNIAARLRIDAVLVEEAVVDLRQRLRIEVGGGDVEHVLEMPVDVEPLHHRLGVLAGAVGEDQLAAGQPLDRVAELPGWAPAASGRSRARTRDSRRASCRARPSARASWCRSACSSPSAAGTRPRW